MRPNSNSKQLLRLVRNKGQHRCSAVRLASLQALCGTLARQLAAVFLSAMWTRSSDFVCSPGFPLPLLATWCKENLPAQEVAHKLALLDQLKVRNKLPENKAMQSAKWLDSHFMVSRLPCILRTLCPSTLSSESCSENVNCTLNGG